MNMLIGLAIVGAIIVFFIISIYNKLVSLRERFKNAFAQIEVQLKRRYDLIPNLVNTAATYMKHESGTLMSVTAARNAAAAALQTAAEHPTDPAAIEALNAAEKTLAGTLKGLNVQVEAYPDLKANTVMLQLSEELTSTENRVAFARQAFNDAATAYNIQRNTFPTHMLAGAFGHPQDAALLAFADTEAIQAAPRVEF